MGIYLGTTPLTGTAGQRNIGQIIQSTTPLSDAGLHLLDGGVISGGGAYSAFVTHIAGLVLGHSELFTTEANWQTSNDNYGACDKFVYDSVNNTVRLPKRVTDHGVLIKSYSSGADWYRIYSDGWCEQGGETTYANIQGGNTSYTQYHTITFLKSFRDTNYDIQVSALSCSNNAQILGCGADTLSISGAHIGAGTYNNNTIQAQFKWQACGYTDISDLQQNPVYEYIVIANSVKTPVEVDIDEVMTDLNGKVDIADLATCHVVVETYINGSSWYRVYSDGWCEQGGMTNIIADYGTATVNLLKPFSNINYTITKATMMPSTGEDNQWNNDTCIRYATRTNSSFQIYSRGAADGGRYVNWQACGYIR